MRIQQTQDAQHRELVLAKLRENDGYCPCKLQKIPQNICMCQDFLDGPLGPCHCGLYNKIQE